MFTHIACFRWVEGTGPDDVAAVIAALRELPALVPGIRDYRCGADAGLAEGNYDFAVVASFDDLFMERYDAILTPAAAGSAPKGLGSTGDPAFCSLWTLCGMPAISLPLMQDSAGLPIGVQLVGGLGRDARLLRTASALISMLAPPKKRTRRARA